MTTSDIAALINLVGWTLGFALYAMLLVLAYRSLRLTSGARRAQSGRYDYLPLATALLGLLWNAGALATHGLYELSPNAALDLSFALSVAASFAALGFLPAVVVHSTLSDLPTEAALRARPLSVLAYALSSLAAAMHFYAALTRDDTWSNYALLLLTCGFVLLTVCLLLLTRNEKGWRRAVWATALAVFAVSALHLSGGLHHGSHDRWYAELVGHHASLPLAVAVLYQDYRFAFADIFLKRALALLAFVALVTCAFLLHGVLLAALFSTSSMMMPVPMAEAYDLRAVGVLLALWVATGLLYPALRDRTNDFVERFVLRRVESGAWRAELARVVGAHEDTSALLDAVCARLAPALAAKRVRWHEIETADDNFEELVSLPSRRAGDDNAKDALHASALVLIPTAEAPRYEITLGELAGGRRVLSDDIAMLEATAITVARRIDGLRVTHERCEQVRREQEIGKLATEAQLRALRAQVNPHFLFNALTTIGYLIQTSPPRALETLMRLTDLLRRVLRASEEWTPLGEELKLIEAYLDIERTRFEERLRVFVDVAPELRELMVPSLVVQPLVENAIKHGIAPLKAGGEVRIAARVTSEPEGGAWLLITIEDTGAGASAAQLEAGRRKGVGLQNVEERMRLCCGGADNLRIETEAGGGTRVELRIPLRARQASRTPRAVVSAEAATTRRSA